MCHCARWPLFDQTATRARSRSLDHLVGAGEEGFAWMRRRRGRGRIRLDAPARQFTLERASGEYRWRLLDSCRRRRWAHNIALGALHDGKQFLVLSLRHIEFRHRIVEVLAEGGPLALGDLE